MVLFEQNQGYMTAIELFRRDIKTLAPKLSMGPSVNVTNARKAMMADWRGGIHFSRSAVVAISVMRRILIDRARPRATDNR
ncbi:MAG TPA: hypothetical protein VGZ25_16395 [Gemmataceae bacterium]|jgi:hypothetical protein|nr:hypothetical protein [Gemmataceae bacterium]